MIAARASSTYLVAAALTAVVVACGDSGPPNPAPVAADPQPDPSSGGSGGTAPAPIAKRTIETRNPWGGPVGNLLVDGDFEFSIVIDGEQPQSGWYAATFNGGLGYLRGETGGLCRSGLRCGVLEPNRVLLGQGTSALGGPMVASFWLKPPPDRDCAAVVTAYALPCSYSSNFVWALTAVDGAPDADGWCHYQGAVPERTTSTCMYIESNLIGDETALIDAATLLPEEGQTSARSLQILTGERAERARLIRQKVRDRMPFGAPPATKLPIGAR